MKTLIINGSPRKNGATASIISKVQKSLHGEVTIVNTYFPHVSPCMDCRNCWTNASCAINDEMQNIYKAIDETDNIIIASPIYFAELTGSLLSFASRFQFLWTAKEFRKENVLKDKLRYGVVILVDGGDGYVDTALAMGKRLLRTMGAEFKKLIYFSGTDKTESASPLDNNEMKQSIKELSDLFNRT